MLQGSRLSPKTARSEQLFAKMSRACTEPLVTVTGCDAIRRRVRFLSLVSSLGLRKVLV